MKEAENGGVEIDQADPIEEYKECLALYHQERKMDVLLSVLSFGIYALLGYLFGWMARRPEPSVEGQSEVV